MTWQKKLNEWAKDGISDMLALDKGIGETVDKILKDLDLVLAQAQKDAEKDIKELDFDAELEDDYQEHERYGRLTGERDAFAELRKTIKEAQK